jgi:hypothetical protein
MSAPTWFDISGYAKKAGAKFPALVAAQFALESGWGKHTSGKNNYFGIKGKGTKQKTIEYVNGKPVEIVDEFQDYPSAEACVQDLVTKWYLDYKQYKGVNNASTRNEAARMLVKQGYATDPKYADKLIDLMSRNSAPDTVNTKADESLIDLNNAAKYYSGLAHQYKAFEYLQKNIDTQVLVEFTKLYRNSGVASKPKFPLNVPYFYQRDSKTGHGERSCQASAIAMVLEFLDPSLIVDDDEYLRLVFRFGDTVSQAAHDKALDALGVKHQFKTNGSEAELIKILDKGYPIPIGILHRGPVRAPSGGGHYVTLVGYDDKYFFVHDPFGQLDLANGGYPLSGPNDGKNQRYTRINLMKRWLINSKNDGWFWDFSANQIKK